MIFFNSFFSKLHSKVRSLICNDLKDYLKEAFNFLDNLTKEDIIDLTDHETKHLQIVYTDLKMMFLIIENRFKKEDIAEYRRHVNSLISKKDLFIDIKKLCEDITSAAIVQWIKEADSLTQEKNNYEYRQNKLKTLPQRC
jgi:hypothetical protein